MIANPSRQLAPGDCQRLCWTQAARRSCVLCSPMIRVLTAVTLVSMVLGGRAAFFSLERDGMAEVSDADMPGTWIIESATYPVQPLPTNLVLFAVTLKDGGTFWATNIPAGLMFGPRSEASGTWHLNPSKGIPQLTLRFTNPSDNF